MNLDGFLLECTVLPKTVVAAYMTLLKLYGPKMNSSFDEIFSNFDSIPLRENIVLKTVVTEREIDRVGNEQVHTPDKIAPQLIIISLLDPFDSVVRFLRLKMGEE